MFLIAVLVLPLLLVLSWRYNRSNKAKKFARHLKLKLIDDDLENPRFKSEIDGRKISFIVKTMRRDRRYRTDIQIVVYPKKQTSILFRLEPELEIESSSFKKVNDMYRQANRKKLRSKGLRDLKLGDKPFDEAFYVHGISSNEVKRILIPEIRQLMLELKSPPTGFMSMQGVYQYFTLIVKPDKIEFERKDFNFEIGYYKKVIIMLHYLAQQIEKA
ncbi:MAG: hypothetical protein ACQETH_12325 [Candidatus Rifleibacteriota bacterium]